MGAYEFFTESEGRTANEAFNSARDEALYRHGHDGYSGTIAEKSDFVMIDIDGRKLKAMLQRVIAATELKIKRAEKAKLRGTYRDRLPDYEIANIKSWLRVYKELKKQCRVKMSPLQIAETLIEMDNDTIRDKWGPAGCINCTPNRKSPRSKKTYLFFGIASS